MELELVGTEDVKSNDTEYMSNVYKQLLALLESVESPKNMELILDQLKSDQMLTESDVHPLVTPDFVGTDEEKINVLNYWAELIGLLRAINISVISHDNKLGIISQLKAEIDFIDREVNNTTSAPVHNPEDNTTDLRKTEVDPVENPESEEEKKAVIDLTQEEVKPKKPVWWQESIKKVAASKKLTPESLKKMAGIR